MDQIYSSAEILNEENRKTIILQTHYVNLSESSWAILDTPIQVDYESKIENDKESLIQADINDKQDSVSTTEPEKTLYIHLKEPEFIDDQLTDEMRKSLLLWYEKQIDSVTKICENIQDSTDPEIEHYQNCIKNFPKCAVRSIRQLCKCNEDCLFNFNIHERFRSCKLCDNTTSIYDNEYVECCWPLKYIKGGMRYIDRKIILENAKKKFYKEIDVLCQKTDNFNVTKCAVYELQDECHYNYCKDRSLVHLLEQKCENAGFDDQVKEMQEIVHFYIIKFEERPIDLAKRDILNQEYFNFADDSLESANVIGQYLCPAITIASFICLAGGLYFRYGLSKKQAIALILSGVSLLIGCLFIL